MKNSWIFCGFDNKIGNNSYLSMFAQKLDWTLFKPTAMIEYLNEKYSNGTNKPSKVKSIEKQKLETIT